MNNENKTKNNTKSDKKLKEVIEDTLTKYNSLLMDAVVVEADKDEKKIKMISEFINDLKTIKQVCVDRNRF